MNRLRKTLALWLALVYSAQALASIALPCTAMAPGGMAHTEAAGGGAAHAGHHMPAGDSGKAAPDAGCCAEGRCSMSHCQASPALMPSCLHGGQVHTGAPLQCSAVAAPKRPAYALFKPPISL